MDFLDVLLYNNKRKERKEKMSYSKFECLHKIITSDTDFRRELKPSAILNFFQEAAGCNSEEMGIGWTALNPQGLFWVLSKIYVEIKGPVYYGDVVHIETWPHKPNKAIFERSFSVDINGEAKVRAISRWCLLNRENGRIAHASLIRQKEELLIDERAVAFSDWRIPAVLFKENANFTLQIAHSEYDLNYHVNNIKYADYIFNCFTIDELIAWQLKSFQINYVKQTHVGDVLCFYREQISEKTYIIEGIKNGEETVVSARICFD